MLRGLQWSWHNIIYDALPVKVYLLPELFAPYCNLLYIIQPRPTDNLDSGPLTPRRFFGARLAPRPTRWHFRLVTTLTVYSRYLHKSVIMQIARHKAMSTFVYSN